jgi:hypothetical protein
LYCAFDEIYVIVMDCVIVNVLYECECIICDSEYFIRFCVRKQDIN